jgi:prophage regulatory protein
MQKGKFPEPVSLGLRAVGWLESDIDDWINNLQKQGWKKTAGVGVKK